MSGLKNQENMRRNLVLGREEKNQSSDLQRGQIPAAWRHPQSARGHAGAQDGPNELQGDGGHALRSRQRGVDL